MINIISKRHRQHIPIKHTYDSLFQQRWRQNYSKSGEKTVVKVEKLLKGSKRR